ncbi:MAG: peptidyl-prolyl cis-trans isomerase, partial [Thermotogaceae bacterium]|nr:peptidyl-prolyl cis-trans isomerase [Thermotogaceae bacterium]
ELYYADKAGLTVSKDEIEEELDKYRTQINNNKPMSDYIKSAYRSVENYLTQVMKPKLETSLTLQKVADAVASVDEDDMKSYFEENQVDLRNRYDKADLRLVSFDNEASATEFVENLMNVGFDVAASSMGLETNDLPGFTRGIFSEPFEEEIFSGESGKVVGPIPMSGSWYVVEVEAATSLRNFDDFLLSDAYNQETEQLKSDKLQEWFTEYTTEENIGLVFNDPILRTWKEIRDATPSNYEKIREKLYSEVFTPESSVSTQAPDTLKSAYVYLLEKMQSSLSQEMTTTDSTETRLNLQARVDQLELERQKIVENLYEQYPSSLEVAKRMFEFHRGDMQIRYNYYSLLYSEIKPYMYGETINYIYNDLINVQAGFLSIAHSDASTELRADAFYNLYDIAKTLNDATSAKGYLESLRELSPEYIDFETALRDLGFEPEATNTQSE